MTEKEYYIVKAIEQCAEVQKALTKIMVFGPDDFDPREQNPRNNIQKFHEEWSDLQECVDLMSEHQVIPHLPRGFLAAHRAMKHDKMHHYLEWAKEQGTVKE